MSSRIVIDLTDSGELKVQAPLQDKILCYGLLEAARDVIKNYQAPDSRIATPPPGLIIPH